MNSTNLYSNYNNNNNMNPYANTTNYPNSTYPYANTNNYPNNMYPNNYNHFVNYYNDTFQHGGISMEELMIPFVILSAK